MAKTRGVIDQRITQMREVDKKVRFSVRQQHARWIGVLSRRARDNLRSNILRPGERGNRPGARATGAFTFGKGQTFQGYLEEEGNMIGFGYPKVPLADSRTKGAWRSIEFGLGPKAMSHPLAPRGEAKLPLRFTFEPFGVGNPSSRLIPLSRTAGPVGRLIVPRDKRRGTAQFPGRARHPGIEPKRFIQDAWDSYIAPKIAESYRREVITVITDVLDD